MMTVFWNGTRCSLVDGAGVSREISLVCYILHPTCEGQMQNTNRNEIFIFIVTGS